MNKSRFNISSIQASKVSKKELKKEKESSLKSSDFESKKSTIILNIEYICCKKCDNPLAPDHTSSATSYKEGHYYVCYICIKCAESYMVKTNSPLYPIIHSNKDGKELYLFPNYQVINFLWKNITND